MSNDDAPPRLIFLSPPDPLSPFVFGWQFVAKVPADCRFDIVRG
jgi:hypothetical protein